MLNFFLFIFNKQTNELIDLKKEENKKVNTEQNIS